MIFKNEQHESFFKESLVKCRYQDIYHAALVYCLGISEDTRRNVDRIYDFTSGYGFSVRFRDWRNGRRNHG